MSLTIQADSLAVLAESRALELRQHPRVLCVDGGVLRLAVRPEFRGRRAVMLDISTGGIGFILEDPLPSETILVFELKCEPGMESIGRLARVRHCRPHPVPPDAPWLAKAPAVSRFFRSLFSMPEPQPEGHAWLVGCEFDRPLSDAELKQLVARLQALANPVV